MVELNGSSIAIFSGETSSAETFAKPIERTRTEMIRTRRIPPALINTTSMAWAIVWQCSSPSSGQALEGEE